MKLTRNDTIHHILDKNADGTPARWRVNGKIKTWKTRPDDFELPIKHGLYAFSRLTHKNAEHFELGDGIESAE